MRPWPLLALLAACASVKATLDDSGAPTETGEPVVDDPEGDDTGEPALDPVVEEEEDQERAPVVVNELMARNQSTIQDGVGEYDDWVELFNRSEVGQDLSGWGLADDADAVEAAWLLPEGTALGPGERLLVWLDGEDHELHANFSIDADGEALVVVDGDGAVQDAWAFEELPADVVRGRFPDGAAFVADSIVATPGNANPADPGLSLDPSDALFPEDEVITIDLWLTEAAMDALDADPYTDVEGGIGFEGAWFEPVAVRVKGQWGSLRDFDQKVGLRVNLDAFIPGARLRGLEHVTLNNMVQDYSCFHERTTYNLMRAAGVPAPRTAYVALYLNGEYRGLYLHLETIDDQFLERWFDNPNGNLYEGAYGQDVTLSGYSALEQDEQGSEDVDDMSDLAALAALLAETPSEDLVPDLESLVDVDRTLRALAAEVITGHWDGYFYYPNNYRFYHDPSTGQFTLIPWGTDQTFGWWGDLFDPNGRLAWWMLEIPSVRTRYALALWDMADRMRAMDVAGDAALVTDLITDLLEADRYKETSLYYMEYYMDYTVSFTDQAPDWVVEELFPDGEPGVE